MSDPSVRIDPTFMSGSNLADEADRRAFWCIHSEPGTGRAFDIHMMSLADIFARNLYAVDTVLAALNERTRVVAGDQSIDFFPYLSEDLALALWAIYIAEDRPTVRIYKVLVYLILDGIGPDFQPSTSEPMQEDY